MNILQIVSAARTGGVERHVVVLSELLRQRGHKVLTLCPPGEWLPAQLQNVGIPVHQIAMRGVTSCGVAFDLPRFAREHNIDIIHSHLTRATYFALLAGLRAHLPVVTSVHVMTRDFVYRRLFPRPGNQIVTVSEYLRTAMVQQGVPEARIRTIHNGTNFFLSEPTAPTNPTELTATRETDGLHVRHSLGQGRSLDAACQDGTLRTRGERGGIRLEIPPVPRVELPISARPREEILTVHSEWSLPQDAELIGLFARMEEFKGPFVLAKAVRKVVAARPRAYFFFVGPVEPDVQRALWEIADADGVADRLRFTGGRDDVQRLMAAMDVVTLPSRYEACSMAIIEAMALGKPVVATRAGGNPELVQDGISGLLIERTPETLAQALISILADPLRKLQMGEAARHRALTRFSASIMVNQIETLYQEMLERHVVA